MERITTSIISDSKWELSGRFVTDGTDLVILILGFEREIPHLAADKQAGERTGVFLISTRGREPQEPGKWERAFREVLTLSFSRVFAGLSFIACSSAWLFF